MGSEERANLFKKSIEGLQKYQLYDRFSHPVQAGDVVHLLGKLDIMWRVQKVGPVLLPNAPPGMVEVSLVAVYVTGIPGGQPIADLLKVRDASEGGQLTEATES